MSVIAWDGSTVSMDKQATTAGLSFTIDKFLVHNRHLLCWTGYQENGLLLAHWWMDGADRKKFPREANAVDTEYYTRLLVFSDHEMFAYEQYGFALSAKDKFMAWGSGRDFAMGAMAMGASAEKAVEIACRFSVDCGKGIDTFDLRKL